MGLEKRTSSVHAPQPAIPQGRVVGNAPETKKARRSAQMRITLFTAAHPLKLPHFFLPQKDASNWDLSDGPVAKTQASNAGARGSISLSQGIQVPHATAKSSQATTNLTQILRAAVKTRHNQIIKILRKKERKPHRFQSQFCHFLA